VTPQRFLIRNGLRLAVYGQDGDGPALVFRHGLCGDPRQIAEAMQGRGRQSWHGLECAGHGASKMGAPSIAGLAADVAALIETQPAPVVLGASRWGRRLPAVWR
jgi:pimeloyl-ACP methyl ester carboxylesterase